MDQGQKPVNPYAPAGAPYAPGSNTPPPSFAMPMPGSATSPAAPVYSAPENPTETASNSASAGAISSETAPAVPNTSATDPAYTSFSTSASPVFVPDEPPEKPKFFTKKFIIAASVGLVLIVAAIITGLVLQNNRKGESRPADSTSATVTEVPAPTIQAASSTIEAISYLSNLMITGEETSSAPDFGRGEWYISSLSSSEADADVAQKYTDAQKIAMYLNEITSLSENDTNEEVAALRLELTEKLAAYKEYLSIDYYENQLIKQYLDKGPSTATAYANSLFGSIEGDSASILNILKSHYLSFLLGEVSLLDTYASNNCIKDASIDQDCAAQFVTTYTGLKSQKLSAGNFIAPIFESVKTGLARFYELLGGSDA